ncbi:MAG: lipoyl(octanoyl) transferase LipB [Pseudomonadota bacterium]
MSRILPEADAASGRLFRSDGQAVEWRVSPGQVDYEVATQEMEMRADDIAKGRASELVWLLEHPPLFTAGIRSKEEDILSPRFPVIKTKRGGQVTYHGPGQRIAYVMLDLRTRNRDVRAFVSALEYWVIETLGAFGVSGERRADRVGVWVDRSQPNAPKREDKIAAIGVRIRRWVSFHGVSINVEPDLSHFGDIVPCGVHDPAFGVTSLVDLGRPVTMQDVDLELRSAFEGVFGRTVDADAR